MDEKNRNKNKGSELLKVGIILFILNIDINKMCFYGNHEEYYCIYQESRMSFVATEDACILINCLWQFHSVTQVHYG